MTQEGSMTESGALTTPAVQALLRDGTLAGSWTLDPARSRVQLKTRHTWGLPRSRAPSARSPAAAR